MSYLDNLLASLIVSALAVAGAVGVSAFWAPVVRILPRNRRIARAPRAVAQTPRNVRQVRS